MMDAATRTGPKEPPARGRVEDSFDEIFTRAMQTQGSIDHIILMSAQGLVIASKSRAKGKDQRLAALAPVLDDAGETVFNELGLAPLGETMLLGPEGTAYLVRMKASPTFLLLAARGQANLGLLRLVASEIEAETEQLLQNLLA